MKLKIKQPKQEPIKDYEMKIRNYRSGEEYELVLLGTRSDAVDYAKGEMDFYTKREDDDWRIVYIREIRE